MDNSKKYFTIGEIASAHDGDHNEFLNILKTYLDKGLDFIKWVFNVEKLVNTNDINTPLKKLKSMNLIGGIFFNILKMNRIFLKK